LCASFPMVPRMSVVRRPSQGSPVSFKRRPRKKAAPSSEPCRICSARKAARLLPTPTRHRASRQKPLINYHRNEEVRELIPADYAGVMVTDRGKSYDAEEFLGVKQQKCLDHLKENINEVLEHKAGRARSFGLKLKSILREARQLWRDQRAGKAEKFEAEVERIEEELTFHLRPRMLKDEDNQRLLDGIGLQHDRGRV